MPEPGAGVLLAAEDVVLGDAVLAITGAESLLLIVVAALLGFRLAGLTLGVDAKFVPVLPATGFCLGTGFAAGVGFGLALLTPALAAGAAGFLTGLEIFLATGLATTGLATTGLALDLIGAFLPLAALGLPGLAGLLFGAALTGFLTGFLGAALVLDFPAEEVFALFVFAILGTLL